MTHTTNAITLLASLTKKRLWWQGVIPDRNLADKTKKAAKSGTLSYKKACDLLEKMGYEKVKEETWRKK